MNRSRRTTLKAVAGAGLTTVLIAAGLIRPGAALAQQRNDTAFSMKSLGEAMKSLGASAPTPSDAVVITAPSVAENGAAVPVAVQSKLPGTESIMLLIEKNPTPLAAMFGFPAGTEASISTRLKMGQTSDLYALVKAGDRFYVARQEIRIVMGGCG
jgi:sulfur-oxidizing protein SoxY